MSDDVIELEGKVTDTRPGDVFIVKVNEEHSVTCYLSGKLRQNYIRILVGDDVKIEVSPYDLSVGRIIWRGIKRS